MSFLWWTAIVTVSLLYILFNDYFLLRAGSVKVWDPRQKDKPVAIMEPAAGDARRDCWTVAFGNQSNVRCTLE
jgi:hypothetical protein